MTDEPQLIQLRYRTSPWKMMVACMLLNRTQRKQVDEVIDELFRTYPTPEALAAAELPALAELIRTLGFQWQRAQRLVRFSQAWVTLHEGVELDEATVGKLLPMLPGIGVYAVDSYKLFVLHLTDFKVMDKELVRWLEWRNKQIPKQQTTT